MGINDNYVKALTKMASDPKNQEAYRQRIATIQADMQRVREQEVLADFNQWKADNSVVDVPQPKAPVMKSVDELRKPTREDNRKLVNDQRIKETLERKKNAKAINAARTVEQVNKNLANYVQKKQVENAVLKQNKGRDEYTRRQEERKQKLDAATPVTTPEQTKSSPVSNYLTGNSAPNNSFYNNTGVSVSRTADKKAKAQPNKVETALGKAQDAAIGAGEKVVNNPGHFFEELLNLPDTLMRVTSGLYDPKNATTAESIVAGATNALGNTTGDIATIGAKAANKVVDNDLTRSAVNEVARQRQALAEEAQNVAEDHPYAFGTGALAESLAENAALYGLANKALKGTKLAGGVERLAKRLPGGNVASDFYTDVMLGQLADTAIDTPRTIAGNAIDGKYIDENGNVDIGKVLADIGINQAVNLGFNAAFGAGELRRGIKSYPARQAAEQAEKDARDIAFHDLLNATNRNTPEAVAREEADLLTQARQYGKARQIAEANNAKVQLQTPEATAKEEAELLAQARAMGEEREKNLGYHAGDLGKAESLGNQSGNRSTGHFGTGTYFVGDEAKLNTGGYKDRPRESVDFSNYNLYKPKDETQGKELHEFLKGINENYNSSDDAIKSVDEWNQLKEDVQYRAWNEVGEPEEIKGQLERLYGTDAVEDYVERYPKESMYEIADRMTSNATGVDDSNILRRIGRVEDYEADFDKKVQSLFGISGDEARQMIHEIRDEIKSANYDLKGRYAADSASTRFMKRLGYEGVDVRNLKNMDNVEYGSVIYDLKGNDLARQQANFKKNSVDNEGKLAHNEGIKEKTDYGNGGIIKETGTEETVRRGGLQTDETLSYDSRADGRYSVGPEGTEIYPSLPRGRRQGSGDSTVSTGLVVRENVRKAMDEQGVSNMGLKDSSGNYSRYSEALSSARKANEHGAFVDSKTVDELTERGAKAFLNDEGTAGVAVMNDGNIVGVFKHPRDTRKGASTDLIITARENGGDRLDCYGAKLVRKYSEGGFEPVARVKYEYGINPEMDAYVNLMKSTNPNFKEPEIYFMKVRDGESVEDSLKALSNASTPIYTQKQLSELPLMDYEAAEAYRDSLIEQAKQSSANNTAFSMRKNNVDRLATDVKSFANRTELKKPSTVAETKEPVPTLTAKPQKEEKPFRDALDSRLTKDGKVERSFAMNTRIGKVEGIPKEVQQQFMDSPEMYKQLRNADTVANATKAREEAGDIEKAYNTFRSMLKEKNPEAVVMGHQLAKEYSAMGDYDMASTIIRETAEELTKAGQFTQAAAIAMMKNDPMTARAYLEKEIDALNRGAKERFGDGFENFKLTKEEKEMFNGIKPGDTKALKEAYDKVGARLGREYPTTLWQKVVEGRHLAMLFNPRTHIRNTVANVLLLPQRTVSNRVNAVLERGMSAINKDFDVTQSLKGGSKQQKAVGNYLYKTEIANALENAQKYVEDIGGKSGSKLSDYAKDADVFKGSALSHWLNKKTGGKLAESVEKMGGNGAESMLELLRRMDYKALDVEDQIFVKRNFVDRLASYMDAKGIKPSEEVLDAMKTGNNKEVVDQFLAEIPPEGISIALDEALKATFKDDNAFTKMLVNLKKDIGPAGELIMPFTKTPANLAVRAYDYSPAGAVHGIVKAVKSKDVQGIRNGLDRLSKGLTGTGMLAAGYALMQSGLITGGYDKDKDKKQQQIKEGYKPYAIHLGDKYYTYDWAEPASSSLVMASEIYDAMNDGSEKTNLATASAKAIQTGVDTWVNSSPLSSFADLMGSGSVSGSVGERAMETALNFPGSFVPAVVGATSKVSDTTQRNTYDPNNPVKSAMNQVVAKIPELSKTLPAKYDTWGNEIKRYESKGEAAFANYLNPGVYSREKHTPIDDAIEKLYDETGDNGVYPLTAEYKIKLDDGTEKKLSAKEQSEYQKTMGKASYKMVSDFLKSDTAKGLDSGEKVDVIRGMYSFSKALAQKDIAGKEIKDSTIQKAYAEYEKAGGGDKGLSAVSKYYANKKVLNKAGMDNNEANQALVNKGGEKAVQEKLDKKKTLEEYGYKSGSKAAGVYDEKGEEGLKVLNETKSKLETGNQTTSVKNAMNYLDKQSMSDKDKGYYLSQSMPNMGDRAKEYVKKGDYKGFYEYEQKRTAADGDKNGKLKKDEITNYLDRQNMTEAQRKFWFEQLGQKKWKNPYK